MVVNKTNKYILVTPGGKVVSGQFGFGKDYWKLALLIGFKHFLLVRGRQVLFNFLFTRLESVAWCQQGF